MYPGGSSKRVGGCTCKKIVKDKCPSCSGPIVGAVDENYVCNYCGKQIMGVVEKG